MYAYSYKQLAANEYMTLDLLLQYYKPTIKTDVCIVAQINRENIKIGTYI